MTGPYSAYVDTNVILAEVVSVARNFSNNPHLPSLSYEDMQIVVTELLYRRKTLLRIWQDPYLSMDHSATMSISL